MAVLAFDRDWTVDVNPHPSKEAVPLEWVQYWAKETDHEVWAIGNQDLVEEAGIPGIEEAIRRRDGDCSALGEQDEAGDYEWWPEREERLTILADLFPDADDYIVIDDLDLAHVDGWRHYHAWEFVPAVYTGAVGVGPPPDVALSSSETLDSDAAVRDVLVSGFLFELTYLDDGTERTNLVTQFDPDRPARTGLRGPPTFWFETVGNGQEISVRLPDLVDLQPIPFDGIPEPLTGQVVARLADTIETEPWRIPAGMIRASLDDALDAADERRRVDALELSHHALRNHDAAFNAIADPTFELLRRVDAEVGSAVLASVARHAENDPTALEPYVSDLVSMLDPDSEYRRGAAKCLMEVAETSPAATVDAVPALASVADSTEGEARRFAIYALSQIAAGYPEQVYPAVETLVEALGAADDTVQTNASTALGRITSAYPDAAEPIVADIVELLDADAKRVRNNAVGLLGDVAQQYPAVVIEYADAIAALLDDANIQARINASIALNRAGEADPDAVRAHQDRIEAALDDASPDVRANVCLLIGNAEVSVPMHRLRDLRSEDPSETVREHASWAIQQLT